MKLMIIHQQSFIQQVQEQNRELRAIIEGLMGPEDYSMVNNKLMKFIYCILGIQNRYCKTHIYLVLFGAVSGKNISL